MNDNYTNMPHFSYNTSPEEEMPYGIGILPKPIKFVSPISQNPAPVPAYDKSNVNMSCIAGDITESGFVKVIMGCETKGVLEPRFESAVELYQSINNPACNNVCKSIFDNFYVFCESQTSEGCTTDFNKVNVYLQILIVKQFL